MKKILLVNVLSSFLPSLDSRVFNEYLFDVLSISNDAVNTPNNRVNLLNIQNIDSNKYRVSLNQKDNLFINSLYKDYIYHMLRDSQDIQEINFKFYEAVNFWFDYYSNNKIDFVIGMTAFHGRPTDLALDIGIYFDVHVFEKILITPRYFALLYRNSHTFLKNTKPVKPEVIYQSYDYPNTWELILNTKELFKNHYSKFFKSGVFRYIIRCYGIQKLRSHYHKLIYLTRNDYVSGMKHLRLKSSIDHRKIIRKAYFDSIDFFNPKSKYVYFSLNLEPEASTNGKWRISSQIYWIKLISEFLPEGIDLIIKDHPHLINMDDKHTYYLFENSQFYRSPYFYNELKSLKNVKLVNHTISSKELIHNSIINICMNGTVVTESVMAGRPIIILEHNFSLGKLYNNTLFFDNVNELIEFIINLKEEDIHVKKISNHEEVLKDYSFILDEESSPYSFDVIVESILKFFNSEQSF